MFDVPTDQKKLIPFAHELIENCRVSVGPREALYRVLNLITETGRADQTKSLINLMFKHLARSASLMFSPTNLKFSIDYDSEYPQRQLDMGKTVARHVTRQWQRKNIDIMFEQGVFESLKYGACILKQWPQVEGKHEKPHYYAKLVQPWRFGVYNEAETSIDKQPAIVETCTVTMPEVWRRIYHLPNAEKLYQRIRAHARKNEMLSEPQSFFHQVLSTSQINTSGIIGTTAKLGGIVQMTSDAAMLSMMAPQIAGEVVSMHELWVQDVEDYTTIIMIEPDVIVAPYGKKSNLLGVEGVCPYTLIQPNQVTDWFWGRSELVDISEPQNLLSQWADDLRRIFGLQIDKILAFIGNTTVTDEMYAQFRNAGYLGLEQGSDVKDLTPAMPPNAMEMLDWLVKIINSLAGFPPIMQGEGEQGVRAGSHANTLLKTASPTLRDRALLVERQCAEAADKTLTIREAKDGSKFWTKGSTLVEMKESEFLLNDLPEDWCMVVDSHSSSPIFTDENAQLIMALRKQGDVDGEYVLDNLEVPNRAQAKAALKVRTEAATKERASIMQQFPEIGEKMLLKQFTGGRR